LVPDPEGLLQHDFPSPLPSLTIDLTLTLGDTSVATRFPPNFVHKMNITSVQLGTSCLECTVVLTTGELLTYKLRVGGIQVEKSYREAEDKEILILEHLSRTERRRFDPYLMLAPCRGPITACAPSDIG
jgi:syntaxin-binding protein 5